MGLLGNGNISVSEKFVFQVNGGTTFFFSDKEKIPSALYSPNKIEVERFHSVGPSLSLGWTVISAEVSG